MESSNRQRLLNIEGQHDHEIATIKNLNIEYQGCIQTDAYSGYDALGRRPGICHAGCWAHARRKFLEVVKAGSGSGKKGMRKQPWKLSGSFMALKKWPGRIS